MNLLDKFFDIGYVFLGGPAGVLCIITTIYNIFSGDFSSAAHVGVWAIIFPYLAYRGFKNLFGTKKKSSE